MSASSVVLRLRATVAVAAVCFTYGLAAPEDARAQIGSDRYAAIVADARSGDVLGGTLHVQAIERADDGRHRPRAGLRRPP